MVLNVDANRVSLSYGSEATYGTAATGSYQVLRLTGESLKHEVESKFSDELRSDRMRADFIQTGVRAAGGINGELSYGAYDGLFLAGLCDTNEDWTAAETNIVGQTTISFTATDTIADSGSGLAAFDVGEWILVEGSTDNDGIYKLATVAAGTITVTHGTITTESAGDSVSITQLSYATNGTWITGNSYTIERDYEQLTSYEYAIFKGMLVDEFGLNVGVGDVVTANFNFLGSAEESVDTSAGSGYTAAPTNDVLNAINDVYAVFEGGSAVSITDFNFTYKNNHRERLKVGTLGAFEIGSGTIDIEGGMMAYYSDTAPNDYTMYNKYINQTATDFAIVFADNSDLSSANIYVFEFPEAKFSDGQRVAGGINTDVIMDLKFSAIMDATESIAMRICKHPAA